MRRNPLAVLLAFAMLLVMFSGCTPAQISPTTTPFSNPTPLHGASPSPSTSTLSPLPTPTLTATVIPTLVPSPTETATYIPTGTLTPSLTPTYTPQYNLQGVYSIGRCMQFGFSYNDPAPGGTGIVKMCIMTVQVNRDRTMQFNILWHLVSATGQTPNRYIYGNIDAVYLTDEFGHHYNPLANSGKAPDRDENNDGNNSTSGWYLFPAPAKNAHLFTFHDDDGKSVSVRDIIFKTN